MQGKIVGLVCGLYSVDCDGVIFRTSARGLFRNRSIKPTVGDNVIIDDDNFLILDVLERTSFLKRPPIANIDQMLIVESLVEPEFSYLLAFKYLTYANMNGISAKIILTKKDKFTDIDKLNEIVSSFTSMGIEVYVISNKSKDGLNEVSKLFKGHTTCLIGQTGVGKSSLINAINPDFNRDIGEYSLALHRGKHKTKEVILLPYMDGFIADTPGFSSLDLQLYKEDLAKFYPGFNDKYTNCYFSDCLHISESKCEIKKALEEGKISKIAYECYLKLSIEAISYIRRYEK